MSIENDLTEIKQKLDRFIAPHMVESKAKIQKAGKNQSGTVRYVIYITKVAEELKLQPGDIVGYTIRRIGHEPVSGEGKARGYGFARAKKLKDHGKEWFDKYHNAVIPEVKELLKKQMISEFGYDDTDKIIKGEIFVNALTQSTSQAGEVSNATSSPPAANSEVKNA